MNLCKIVSILDERGLSLGLNVASYNMRTEVLPIRFVHFTATFSVALFNTPLSTS
jgi:hypothetical protein